MKTQYQHLKDAMSEIDWRSPNTHVFFIVQVIGLLWLIFVMTKQFISPLPLQNIGIVILMVVARYYVGMWFVTAWRHRYFSHYSFRINPRYKLWLEPIVAFICSMDAQRGVIKWALDHINHHKYSDTINDLHSCKQRGIAWCHILWVTRKEDQNIDWNSVPKYLRNIKGIQWIENRQWVGILVGGAIFSFIGASISLGAYESFFFNLVYSLCAYFFSTTILWNGTFLINSAMHLWGKQRYQTGDESRNSLVLAILTLGEGWHNNHHYDTPKVGWKSDTKTPVSQRFWQAHTCFEKAFDWSGISIRIMMWLGILRPIGS